MTAPARLALAAAAGAVAALGFPTPGWWPLLFIAWAPLLLAIDGVRARRGALLGLIAGLVFHGVMLRWMASLTVWGWLALVAYLALYTALFAAAAAVLVRRRRWWTAAALAATWAALEWLRSWLFTGFGWGALGYGLADHPALLQLAALGGVTALSFCVVAANALAAQAWPALRRRDTRRGLPLAAAALAIPLAMALHGSAALAAAGDGDGTLRVAVVQADVSPLDKWEKAGVYTAFSRYTGLSQRAAAQRPDLIVWPETAIPVALGAEPGRAVRTRGLRRAVDSWQASLLFGVPEAIADQPSHYWNSARLFVPGGTEPTPYRKRRLVPFGEYTPLPGLFWWVPKVVSGPEFVHGGGGGPFVVSGARVGVLICFEDVFGDEAVARADDSELLAVITNDAWFGPVGIAQHRDITVLRAVETRRAIARAANTGVSELVDPHGRVLARAAPGQSYAVAELPRVRQQTWFARWPDGFPMLTLAGALIALARVLVGQRSPQ